MAFFRPNGMRYEFLLSDQPVGKWDMRPLAIGEDFTTILSTVRAADFYKLFGSGPVPAPSWDSIRFDVPQSDGLSVNPSYVDVRKVECVDADRFIPASSAPPVETSNATSDSQPVAIGYAKIAASSGGTPGVSERFSFLSNTTEQSAVSLTTETVLDLTGADSPAVGIAFVNPDSRLNVIDVVTQDAAGKVLRQATVTLKPGMHLAKFAFELVPIDRTAATIRCRAKLPFAVVALEISHDRVRLIAKHDSVRSNGAAVVPHFVANGGWGTELVLSNPSERLMTGVVQLKSSTGEPMLMTIDGKTATEFPYTIAAGGTVILATGTPAH
jgi:hypothetical protein